MNGEAIAEGSGAVEITTSSTLMEVKAITVALRHLQSMQYRRAIIVTDSMSTLQKFSKENLYADWVNHHFKQTWTTPGHACVQGNERADSLAGTATTDNNNIIIDPPTIIKCVPEQIMASRPESSSYRLSLPKDKGVQPGEAVNCNTRGITHRR